MHPHLLVPAAKPAAAKDAATVETVCAWPLYCNVNCNVNGNVNINGNETAVQP
jgi:hypothetical protein